MSGNPLNLLHSSVGCLVERPAGSGDLLRATVLTPGWALGAQVGPSGAGGAGAGDGGVSRTRGPASGPHPWPESRMRSGTLHTTSKPRASVSSYVNGHR